MKNLSGQFLDATPSNRAANVPPTQVDRCAKSYSGVFLITHLCD